MEKFRKGIAPFWFWNGDITEEGIREQLALMREEGLSGVMLHPRQGMKVPYLSSSFFDLVAFTASEAERLGLDLWLYDEFPYPSAAAAGEVVLENPEYAVKELLRTEAIAGDRVELEVPRGRVLSAMAYRLDGEETRWDECIDLSSSIGVSYSEDVFQYSGMTRYNKKRYFQGSPVKRLRAVLPAGKWRILVFTERVMEDFKYFGSFPDPLRKEAVRSFIEKTHGRYASRPDIACHFGKTIKGFFSDEVTAFPPESPWSGEIVRYVREKDGIDLIRYLPALYEDMGDMTGRVRYAYWNAATELFLESYDRQVEAWCSTHDLLYICEKPYLRAGQARYIDVPGIDTAHWKAGTRDDIIEARYRGNGKLVSSAAHFYGKDGALCEPFHSIGWGMTLQDMKAALDWLTLTGITLFNPHAAYYTTDGLRKHDAPPSSFYQMPWWRDYKELTGYLGKVRSFLSGTERVVRILIADPIASVWTSLKEEKQRLSASFASLQNCLLRNGLDYYIADTDLFEEAETGSDGEDAFMEIRGERFRFLVLPYMKCMEKGLKRKVEEYRAKGGKLFFVGLVPYLGVDGDVPMETGHDGKAIEDGFLNDSLVASSGDFYKDAGDAVEALRAEVSLPFSVRTALPFPYVTVRAGEGFRLFGVNLSQNEGTCEVTYRGRSLRRTLSPCQSLLVDTSVMDDMPTEDTLVLDTDEVVPMKVEGPNALLLDSWDLSIDGKPCGKVEPVCIYETMESLGLSIPCRGKAAFGCTKVFSMDKLELCYSVSFTVSEDLSVPLHLVVEPGATEGEELVIAVNGERAGDGILRRGIRPEGYWIDITELVRTGENVITVTLRTDRCEGGLVNPLYIAGDFSVDGHILSPFRGKGAVNGRKEAGIPCYSGSITYTFTLDGKASSIALPSPDFEDAATLTVNGRVLGTCCWSPYAFSVPDGLMTEDGNKAELRVDTTLLPLFEGKRYDRSLDRYVPV